MALSYYDRSGQPITLDEWGSLLTEDITTRVVAKDDLVVAGGPVCVSTVWLGLDHSWDDGPPLIFETMVFGGALEGEMERYSTEAEAVAGHAAMCARVRAS